MVSNITSTMLNIEDGERIAQGELILSPRIYLEETEEQPKQKTDREGGFGSTDG